MELGNDGTMSELLDDLPTAHIEFPLRDGYVADWLVLGPLHAPLADVAGVQSKVARQLVLNTIFADADEVIPSPAERATSSVTVGDGVTLEGTWRVVNTLEDRCVDVAHRVETVHSLCAWAYAQIALPERIDKTLRLTTASPAQVWINGAAVFAFDEVPDEPIQLEFAATLDAGTNEILIRVANVGSGAVPMMVGLAIGTDEGTVKLPTLLEPVKRRQKLADVMALAYVPQPIFSGDQRVVMYWPADMQMIDALTARLQKPPARIHAEANPMVQKGVRVDFGRAAQFPEGAFEILLQPQFEEYYVQNMRVQRRIPLQIRNAPWSTVYYSTYAERRIEALEDAARREGTFAAELAKSALGQWDALSLETIDDALDAVAQRAEDSEVTLLLLLGWVARMGDWPDFPQEMAWALAERVPAVLERIEAGSSPVKVACHLIAGQLYPQRSFADLNTGEWHQAQAEAWLMQWLQTVTRQGLPDGDGEASYAAAIVATSHLVDLAQADAVAELAAAALDKVGYQMALHCFLGAWGGCPDAGGAETLISARLGPLAGVARLWWGQGAFNDQGTATVALACSESYVLPEIIAAVGLDRQQESWLRRQDVVKVAADGDDDGALRQINRAAFRTGDYLLASTQGDWATGSPGARWKVTLGAEAVVFGNRPAHTSVHPAWQSGYWSGDSSPVRVAQWQDVLAVCYGPTDKASLPFTHAYFPKALFDEVYFGEGWAMARKGHGYVALTATDGVQLVTTGRYAHCELRAAPKSVWLVQMGRAETDGTFTQFAEKIRALPLELSATQMTYTSLRGNSLRFDGVGELAGAWQVDGTIHALTAFPHFESIYGGAPALPAEYLDIQYMEHVMRLDFGAPQPQDQAHG